MTDRPDDDFDAAVHRALGDVTTAIRPDPGLADRLIANARGDDRAVVRLDSRRPASRWIAPLLAAAAVVVLAVGGVTAVNLLADSGTKPAHHGPTPVPRPTPTKPFVPAPSVVPHFRTYSMQFADPQHGWAIGEAQCPSGKRTNCATLLATSDGGAKWRQVGMPRGLVSPFIRDGSCITNGGITGPCVDHVLFANPSVGYLWGLHEIYWTTDGGRNWSRYQNPDTDWDGAAQLVIAGDSIVRIAPIAQCSAGCAGSVQRAPLGTTDFTPSDVPGPQVGLYSSGLRVVGSDVYLFGGGVLDKAGPGLLRSPDGGRTWSLITRNVCGTNSGPGYAPYGLVADDRSIVAECGRGIRVAQPGSEQFGALRRLPRDNAELYAADSGDGITIAYSRLNVDTPNGSNMTTFYRTTNGGRSWLLGPGLPVDSTTVTFVNGSVGYAASDRGVLYTTQDGGMIWSTGSFAG